MQVVANLNGNPAHLALLCLNRQKPFEVDLTGSELIFQVRPRPCMSCKAALLQYHKCQVRMPLL